MSRDLYIADALSQAWRKVLEPVFGEQTHCIEAAKVARAALARVKVKARPLPCGIVVFNAEAFELTDARVPVKDWPKTAWSCGVDPDTKLPGPGWNGHLVLAGDGWIGDFSAAQFSRPGLINIHAWVSPVPPGWSNEPVTVSDADSDVTVTVWPRPELAAWRNTGAWRGDVDDGWIRELLAAMLPEGATI